MKRFFKFHKGLYILLFTVRVIFVPEISDSREIPSLSAEPVAINISASSEVLKDTVTLGDIAVFEGNNKEYTDTLRQVIVGRVQGPGKPLTISRDTVISRINQVSRSNQRVLLNMPVSVMVEIASRKIDKNEISDGVRDFLIQHFSSTGSVPEVASIEAENDVYVPRESNVQVLYSLQPGYSGSNLVVVMDVSGDDGYKASYRIPVLLKVMEEVVVAVRDIQPREIISASDVKLEFVSVTDTRRKTFHDLSEVVGKLASSVIRRDAVLTEGVLKEVPIIARGAQIIIVADSNGFRITVPGVAQQSGLRDEVIRVVNVRSQKMVLGKVIDSKTVMVQF